MAISYHGDSTGRRRRQRSVSLAECHLTGFDDDRGRFRGKQHQSVKILRGLGTPEDQVSVH